MSEQQACSGCEGRGGWPAGDEGEDWEDCPECEGSGWEPEAAPEPPESAYDRMMTGYFQRLENPDPYWFNE